MNSENMSFIWKSFVRFLQDFWSVFLHLSISYASTRFDHRIRIRGNVRTFPTAEALDMEQMKIIHEVLGCDIRNQYASSRKGIPFWNALLDITPYSSYQRGF